MDNAPNTLFKYNNWLIFNLFKSFYHTHICKFIKVRLPILCQTYKDVISITFLL